ncbi:MAG: aldo/keto reductase, partial [Planctomycetota bacterium]
MPDSYRPADDRYDRHEQWFRRCGRSGLKLPAISIGCWHNFGAAGTDAKRLSEEAMHENCRAMLHASFDRGITHFDLANNYGPPPGSAETRVGRILKNEFAGHRDEIILSSKAGYHMWAGPYGEFNSRKHLVASCDQSLRRMGVDYFDIFYSHRPDGDTPLEETLFALDTIVRQGKALYVGISSYDAERTAAAVKICRENHWATPIIHQPSYSMLDRWIEPSVISQCHEDGLGTIVFCPLAQ